MPRNWPVPPGRLKSRRQGGRVPLPGGPDLRHTPAPHRPASPCWSASALGAASAPRGQPSAARSRPAARHVPSEDETSPTISRASSVTSPWVTGNSPGATTSLRPAQRVPSRRVAHHRTRSPGPASAASRCGWHARGLSVLSLAAATSSSAPVEQPVSNPLTCTVSPGKVPALAGNRPPASTFHHQGAGSRRHGGAATTRRPGDTERSRESA